MHSLVAQSTSSNNDRKDCFEVPCLPALTSAKLTWNPKRGFLWITVVFKGPLLRFPASFPKCVAMSHRTHEDLETPSAKSRP